MTSARSEQIYVSRGVRNGLEALAQMHCATHPEGSEGPSITTIADGLADQILRNYLDTIPALAERRKAIRDAIRAIDERYAQPKP